MEHWGVSTLDELAEKFSREPLKETYQEDDTINNEEIELFMQLDMEELDYLIEKYTSLLENNPKTKEIR